MRDLSTSDNGRDPFNQHSDRSDRERGPPQKVDLFFRNSCGWTEPIHWVLDRNFRKFWLNGSHPKGPNSVMTIPFILSGSPSECWLHTCDACVITNRRLGLRAPLVVHNKQTSKFLEFVNLSGSICTGSRLFRNGNLLTAHEHVANSYIVPSLYIYFLSLY